MILTIVSCSSPAQKEDQFVSEFSMSCALAFLKATYVTRAPTHLSHDSSHACSMCQSMHHTKTWDKQPACMHLFTNRRCLETPAFSSWKVFQHSHHAVLAAISVTQASWYNVMCTESYGSNPDLHTFNDAEERVFTIVTCEKLRSCRILARTDATSPTPNFDLFQSD